MEPVPEDHEDHNHVRWSGSEGSLESYDVDYTSDEEDYLSDLEPTQNLQYRPDSSPDRSSDTDKPGSPPEPGGGSQEDEDSSGDATSDPHPGGSPGPIPGVTPGASRTPSLGSKGPHPGCISPAPTFSSPASPSLSPGCGDMTLTQALAPEEPLVASSRWAPAKPLPGARVGVGARGVGAEEQAGEAESSEGEEGGGCREAPPAAVSSGIRPQGAEPTVQRSAEVQRADRCRPDSHRRRQARPSHIESESERHVKETKSKCKRLALLLTDAPNPQNKGALLFKKRRQRVRRYTLVSYGTAWIDLDHEDQVEGDLGCRTASDSEPEEDYSLHRREHVVYPDGGNGEEMEGLSGTEGKGVMMFARRRQRLEEMALEQEELRSRGAPPEEPELQNHHHTEEAYMKSANLAPQQTYVDTSPQLTSQQQENIKPMTNQIPEPKPLVPNRTAKPFGFINSGAATMPSSINAPVAKKHELIFKVPVPVNTSAQVWSPTGDIIASRDERISVPAKNAGTLPGSKRRVASKQVSSDHQLQNRGDRKSYIEPEEDFFSLGAEACNFMQPRSVKLKIPPPVAPKPSISPNRQPWLSPPSEPFNPPRSPVSPSFANAAGPQGQSYAPQQDWSQFQQTPNSAPFQTAANAWAPVGASAQNQPQPTRNSWSAQPTQSPAFGRSYSMTLPARLRPLPSPTSPLYSGGPPGFQASFRRPPQRQASWQEGPSKAPTPWEAACRSPLGSVDEAFGYQSLPAFGYQSLPASVASGFGAAGHRRSLPEPPADWTHRVALEVPCSPGPGEASRHSRPATHTPPAFCGPPFRRGGRLVGGGRVFLGFMASH